MQDIGIICLVFGWKNRESAKLIFGGVLGSPVRTTDRGSHEYSIVPDESSFGSEHRRAQDVTGFDPDVARAMKEEVHLAYSTQLLVRFLAI